VFAIYKWYPFLIAMYRYAGSFISGHARPVTGATDNL